MATYYDARDNIEDVRKDPIGVYRMAVLDFLDSLFDQKSNDEMLPIKELISLNPVAEETVEKHPAKLTGWRDMIIENDLERKLYQTPVGKITTVIYQGAVLGLKGRLEKDDVPGYDPDDKSTEDKYDEFRDHVEMACYILLDYIFSPDYEFGGQTNRSYVVPAEFWTTYLGNMIKDALIFSREDQLITMTKAAGILGCTVANIGKMVIDGRVFCVPDCFEPNPRRRNRVFLQEIQDAENVQINKTDAFIQKFDVISEITGDPPLKTVTYI